MTANSAVYVIIIIAFLIEKKYVKLQFKALNIH